jgi:hypothetical protein
MDGVTKPDFCTTVGVDEYNYKEQFDAAMKGANQYHFTIHKECPPPYFPFDAGKVYGLLVEIERLKTLVEDLRLT